jgi:hypothetical protein
MARQSLAEQPQPVYGGAQRRNVPGGAHQQAHPGKSQQNDNGETGQLHVVDQPARPDQGNGAQHRAGGVHRAEFTMGQGEGLADLAAEQRDEEGLPETGRKTHKGPEGDQGPMCAKER